MISVENVHYTYPAYERPALQGVDFAIDRGECVLLTGQSGCGKSTLIRCLNGLIPHFHGGALRGRITINGKDISAQPVHKTGLLVGSVFQDPDTQFFALHVDEEIAFGLEQRGMAQDEMRETVGNSLAKMGLEDLAHRSIFALSGGEKQRVALAAVTALDPPVLVLDEPSASLDPSGIQSLRALLEGLKENGHTIIIAEHRLYWLNGLADRVAVMDDGQINFDGSPERLNDNEYRNRMGLRAYNIEDVEAPSLRQSSGHGISICAENVCFSYAKKSRQVLTGIDFSVSGGEAVGLVGANGAGKSTFARCLCGLSEPSAGRFLIDGKNAGARKRLSECAMVLQRSESQLAMPTVRDEIASSGLCRKIDENKICSVMDRLNLTHLADHHPLALSSGQKQRVAVAAATARGSRLLIFDEPTTGMDGRHLREFANLISELKDRGIAVVIMTHDYELIRNVCDRVNMLHNGKLAWGDDFTIDSKNCPNGLPRQHTNRRLKENACENTDRL